MSLQDLPPLPALVVGQVSHTRHTPIRHGFTYRAYQWLVDIDDLPQLPLWLRPLASFRATDHLVSGSSGRGIRGDLAQFLTAHGAQLDPSDRVIMLANARVFGYVFDPLTVFWIFDQSDAVKAVVFEVHNTYGNRHSYLLEVDGKGRATTEKAFYVSPFNDLTGHYEIRLKLDSKRIMVTVRLHREGEQILTATTYGVPRLATHRELLRVSATHLFMTHRVSALIRWNGIKLWLRRLPIIPRGSQYREVAS